MATQPAGTIGPDQAAALLRCSPAELQRLVGEGVIPRAAPGAFQPGAIIAAYIEYLKAEPDRRSRAPTQPEIAAHLGISDRRVRELLAKWGWDHKSTPLADIRLKYINELREEAAGRASGQEGGLDLVQERAALARSQREAQEIKNALAREEYAPVELLTDTLAAASQAIVDRLDLIPGELKKHCPELPDAARTAVLEVIISARNECVRKTARLADDELGEGDQPVEDEEPEALAEAEDE